MNVTWHRIAIVIAVVLFAIATIVALGGGDFKYSAALVPAGLLFFAAAFL
jgi:hypothetical protein